MSQETQQQFVNRVNACAIERGHVWIHPGTALWLEEASGWPIGKIGRFTVIRSASVPATNSDGTRCFIVMSDEYANAACEAPSYHFTFTIPDVDPNTCAPRQIHIEDSKPAEAPCRACSRMNDVGVKVCWCCGGAP